MNDPVSLFGLAATPLELVSFVLSVLTVLLNIRRNHWAWLFAIVSSAAYSVVFYRSRLYGDMALQVVFIVVSVWGWHSWLRGGAAHGALQVTRLDGAGWRMSLAGWAVGFVLLAYFLKTWTDTDVPHADGFLTAGSLVGQVLLSRKKVENWHVWIAVDILYVGLYLYKNLVLTAILYALFVVMAVIGLRTWRRAAQGGAA
ncbi:nicotinamide riboside transporter PnuC [Massilia psychrophila]|uniref:Nicotinamide riboside transporter PnuC n=1 Tax=Massilia psychrophila TaxID=1603353 RepID=A0A2G8SWV3_9BURK|nr:nicotinamide riboside transporter PnuC [Massilia psychrophila]PIL38275.1 transporter [Massilia psychrophila]GGE81124.1 transporter [Massilia psychrophila]